jgi:signal transduction histidine kinase
MSKNRRILVIDDNPSVHTDFKSILVPSDNEPARLKDLESALFGDQDKTERLPAMAFDVDCASQGQQGYEMVMEAVRTGRPYSLAFVDVRMPPGWDGIETAERIWAEYPDLQVVICTAYSDYSWGNILRRLGHSDRLLILKKPFDIPEVMQLAMAMTEKWHLMRRSRAHLEEVEKRVLEQTREFQEFAYAVSHDLQEPLRKVIAFGDRLRDKCAPQLPEEGLDYLNRMQDATKRMSALINDLLELSRVSTKARPPMPVNLNTIVSEVLSDLEVLVEQTHGKVEVSALPTINADPTQMRQLFQNLIGNALKFRKKDVAPLIKVTAQPATIPAAFEDDGAGGGRLWQIKVQDNGIGFEEKYSEKIFEVFQRLHGRSEYQGSGVGLALCRKIVVRHNGSISAEASPNAGATFLITVPESVETQTPANN